MSKVREPLAGERDKVVEGAAPTAVVAFDAATGRVRWRFRANGRISGSASVVDGIVYFSTLQRHVWPGRPHRSPPDGEYTPVVANSQRLYVVGYRRVFAFAQRAPS